MLIFGKSKEIDELTARARPPWTEMKRTPMNAVNMTRKSNLSIFQML